MKPNYKGDKRRKEEQRKKKQDAKRNKRLNKPTEMPMVEASSFGFPEPTPTPEATSKTPPHKR